MFKLNKIMIIVLLLSVLLFVGCTTGSNDGNENVDITSDINYEYKASEVSMDVEYYKDAYVLFHGYTCPHCIEEIEFLEEYLPEHYPDVEVYFFEVIKNSDNQDLFDKFAEKYDTSSSGYPRVFVNDKVIVGFDKGTGPAEYNEVYKGYLGFKNVITGELEALSERTVAEHIPVFNVNNNSNSSVFNLDTCDTAAVESCVDEINEDIDKENSKSENFGNFNYIFLLILAFLISFLFLPSKFKQDKQKMRYWYSGLVAIIILTVFVFVLMVPESVIAGFAGTMPFWLFTFIIAIADGFNPCAFTVLFILLSLLTYTKNKKTMFMIGNVFVFTSAIMYFIFIMIMVFAGSFAIGRFGDIFLKVLGAGVIIAGAINLKDYLFLNKGISLTLSSKEKSKITKKAREIVKKIGSSHEKGLRNLIVAIGLTFVLAVGVNLVELGCSAILPAVYMSALIKKFGAVSGIHFLWTAFYAVVYVIPLFAILFNFIQTFKSDRLSEDQGRVLKLISGLLMFLFGIIMIFKPGMLGV